MTDIEVLTQVQHVVSVMKEPGAHWVRWEDLCFDPFWEKTHRFIVDTLSSSADAQQRMNARYMAERYFGVEAGFQGNELLEYVRQMSIQVKGGK